MFRKTLMILGFAAALGGAPMAARAMPVDHSPAVTTSNEAQVEKTAYYRRYYRPRYYRPHFYVRRHYYRPRYYRPRYYAPRFYGRPVYRRHYYRRSWH